MLSAEALFEKQALEFLTSLKFSIPQLNLAGVSLVGPMLAAQQKKSGKYRANLLIHSLKKSHLHEFLAVLLVQIEKQKLKSRVKWYLDVDPQDVI